MKIAAVLLLAPVIALAQQPPQQGMPRGPQGQMDQAEILKQMQQHMLPVLEESLPNMREMRACVAASNNKEDLTKCAEMMRAFQRQMMPPGSQMPPPNPEAEQPDIEWSPEIKQQILAGIDQSITQTAAMKGCLESSSSPEQMNQCMRKSGLSGGGAGPR